VVLRRKSFLLFLLLLLLRHEELVAAFASPDLGIILLLCQGSVRAANGHVNGVARGAGAALALARRGRRTDQQSVAIDGVRIGRLGIGIGLAPALHSATRAYLRFPRSIPELRVM